MPESSNGSKALGDREYVCEENKAKAVVEAVASKRIIQLPEMRWVDFLMRMLDVGCLIEYEEDINVG